MGRHPRQRLHRRDGTAQPRHRRDTATVGRLALDAGVDVDMVSNIYFKHLPAEVRAGRLPLAEVDSAVRRVLRVKYEMGLFADPYRHSSEARERALTLSPPYLAEARDMARRSIVLLKNNGGALPLSKSLGTLAVIGTLADDARSALGNWAAVGRPEDAVTILAGIRQAVGTRTRVLYAPGAPVDSADTTGFAEAVRVARQADAVVLVLGEHQDMSAEARNRTSLDLPGVQLQLAQAVVATDKPVVVILENGRPLSIPWLADHVPAILETLYLGVQMGPAVADVLFSDANRGASSGVVPRTVRRVPVYYNHQNAGRPPDERERYTSKYLDVPWTPQWAFGHGLSYTTFAYDAPTLSATQVTMGDSVVVRVKSHQRRDAS
ncbi:MAG: glycoside hydrolase family 3 C-terminal domain-containing protein [Gemmatimonadetes bacterium]|nr:glycoside hydrolase family 3 C-terminal domain-containing protein [Gemmatimonadota bacterium]